MVSHDASFVLRRGGRETYHYDRWAALQIDRLLLTGPNEVAAYIESLERRREPVTVTWLCGAVLVDLDRGELLYWADQFFGREAALHRYYRALLAERWPGFQLRWTMRPLLELAAALGREPDELAEARARVTPIAAQYLDELFTGHWRSLRESFAGREHELAAWIAESGEPSVRAVAEYDCDAWVTLRAADGRLFDQVCEAWSFDSLLRAGPELVELARVDPRAEPDEPGFERNIRETLFIDEATRTVHWWKGLPEWMNPAGFCDSLWPGWTLLPDPRGPRGHVERAGRSFASIRTPRDEARAWLEEQLEQTLGSEFAPGLWLSQVAARVQAEQPDGAVRIETSATNGRAVGVGTIDDELRARLDALIDVADATL
jgi:hypothetical protein